MLPLQTFLFLLRPRRQAPPRQPQMTRGIDVATAHFDQAGPVPMEFTFDLAGKINIRISLDDITRQTADALVNPTNPTLSSMSGVSRAIMEAAGHDSRTECREHVMQHGELRVAQVVHTGAGGE